MLNTITAVIFQGNFLKISIGFVCECLVNFKLKDFEKLFMHHSVVLCFTLYFYCYCCCCCCCYLWHYIFILMCMCTCVFHTVINGHNGKEEGGKELLTRIWPDVFNNLLLGFRLSCLHLFSYIFSLCLLLSLLLLFPFPLPSHFVEFLIVGVC